jgi:hypothetical protein
MDSRVISPGSLPVSEPHDQLNRCRVFPGDRIGNCPRNQNFPSAIVRILLISPSIIRASNADASAHQQLSGTSGDIKKSIEPETGLRVNGKQFSQSSNNSSVKKVRLAIF